MAVTTALKQLKVRLFAAAEVGTGGGLVYVRTATAAEEYGDGYQKKSELRVYVVRGDASVSL